MPRNPLPPVPAPAVPKKGLKFRLEPSNGAYWANVSITKVNSRSFYASHDGNRERHLLAEWDTWLRDLCAQGTVFLGGHPIQVQGISVAATFGPTPQTRAALYQRMRRARNIAGHYALTRKSDRGELWCFEVKGGSTPYTVTAHPDWAEPPSCDCPDATRRKSPWCKHSLAVLMSNPALRCQLLDILVEAP